MKIIIMAPAMLLLGMSGYSQQNVTIRGTVTGDTKGHNKIYLYGKESKTDSAVIKDGHFTFSFPFERTVFPCFYTEYDMKEGRGYRIFGVLIDRPGTVSLDDVDLSRGMSSARISGMQSAVDFQDFETQILKVEKQMDETIRSAYAPAARQGTSIPAMAMSIPAAGTSGTAVAPSDGRGSNTAAKGTGAGKTKILPTMRMAGSRAGAGRIGGIDMKTYMHAHDSLKQMRMPAFYEQYVSSHPDTYAAAYALDGQGRSDLDPAEVEKVYRLLSPRIQQSESGRHIADYIAGTKNSAEGSTVKDFTLPAPDGKSLTFGQLKGKYVLIDFWASWCGPCKASFPHMKELYKRYKGNKFEIYSVSIDKDKAAWLKELKKQQLPWLQALDTKNVSESGFAVTAVPTAYLIDPQGKIVMKQVGFESGDNPMEKKLNELFGTK